MSELISDSGIWLFDRGLMNKMTGYKSHVFTLRKHFGYMWVSASGAMENVLEDSPFGTILSA